MEKVETASKATKAKKTTDWSEIAYRVSLVAINGLIYGVSAGVGGLAVTRVAGSLSSGPNSTGSTENVVPMKRVMHS